MAKTELNKKLDDFFERYANTPITKEIFDASGMNISEVNDYGNLLHGAINYEYNPSRILEFVEVLLKKGIDVNYRGKFTGFSFIHLALYGYTGKDEEDHSYSENFIAKLISTARNYGFDVNIRDDDNEDIAICAVASEIYSGSVIKIIEALGPDYKLPDNFLENYQEYLKEAKTEKNKKWQKRLEDEQEAVNNYVNHLNIDEINILIKAKKELLINETSDLDYEKLSNSYENIHNLFEEIKKLISKRAILELDNSEYENFLNSLLKKFQNLLSKHLDNIEQNPNQSSLQIAENIATCFNIDSIIPRVQKISKNYQEYLSTLRNEANNAKTINECTNMINQIKESEIFAELNAILEANIENLNLLIKEAKDSYSEVKKMGNVARSFINVENISEEQNYVDLTVEELKDIVISNKNTTSHYQSLLKDEVTDLYKQLYMSLNPLFENNLINQEDIETIFALTSKPVNSKRKQK